MSLRTAEAMRAYQAASSKAHFAKTDPRVSPDQYRQLVRETQLRKSIFDNLNRLEPITAADHKLPKKPDTPEQQRARRRGEALVATSRRGQSRTQRASLILNPLYETSSR